MGPDRVGRADGPHEGDRADHADRAERAGVEHPDGASVRTSWRRSGAPHGRRLLVAVALSGLVVVAGCDTGPGGTVDPDVVNGEESDAGNGGMGTTEDSP